MSDNRTVSADGWEHCVALGSVGFSRGIHYWEFTIDKYTADTDPAFGIARIDVDRTKMLGKFASHFPIKNDDTNKKASMKEKKKESYLVFIAS